MYIIIVGVGKVGYALAEQLSRENHDIVVIDNSQEALRRPDDALDVMCIRGNGASAFTLKEAGAAKADMIIAVTNMDEVNMLCCQIAKRIGAKFAVARIRDTDYNRNVEELRSIMGIDMVVNPEYATALEISRLLRFPTASNIETFYRGRVELVGFRVHEGDFMVGRPLSALHSKLKGLPILFCAAERGSEVIIPNGSYVPEVDDHIYIMGNLLDVNQFFKLLDRYTPRVKDVFIVGGGRISFYLASMLQRMNIHTKIIECNEEKCRELSAKLPHALVIHGDGTDQEILESEHMTHSHAFVALTDRDEDNLIISMYALLQRIPKVVAKSNRPNYSSIASAVGIDCIISPKLMTATRILQLVRSHQNSKGSVMQALYQVAGNKVEAAEFVANKTTKNLGVPLKDCRIKRNMLVGVIVHKGKIIIPEGNSYISEGDSVIVVSNSSASILDLNDLFVTGG